jgi:3-oxoadipate enol-lactonase
MPSLPVSDFSMNYVEAGAGQPLLLLHGLGGSIDDWERQIPVFSQTHRVIAPDLRGFGASTRGHAPSGIPRMAADVRELLDKLGVTRFDLIGHSMGGAVALQLALERPRAVERLVIANSVPTFRPETLQQWFEVAYRFAVMGLLGPALLARISAKRQFPAPGQEALRERFAARGARTRRSAYLAALYSLVRWSVVERLRDLRQPVLVIGSSHDFFSREETVKFAHALPSGRLHIFDGAHHGLPLEAPDAFNALVLKFLKRRSS